MRISVAADELTGVAQPLVEELRRRGHEPILHGAYVEDERPDWAWACESAARDVAEGRADQAIVLCWTGTGASIAANKVPGVRAALCSDIRTVEGARRWNDANVLALSLRRTGLIELEEMLDAWFSEAASDDPQDLENIAHLSEIEASSRPASPSQLKPEASPAKAARPTRAKRAAKS
jgi:ribose 5-phosphate isomerase B